MAGRLEDPFGMKFILPEHATLLYQHQLDKQLVRKPVIEEDELAEFQLQVMESIKMGKAITVTWWKCTREDLGVNESARGIVEKIDDIHKMIKLVKKEEVTWIFFNKIVSIQEISNLI
ncbi:YolD-like family protein [Brevibacillus sp. IT-7CA2]|uniref:YolD-like family protein n=1 Tax=Brevibacillus sp. IT-7CA2 TaxID=3026436 RepID=UPI0039E00F5C